MPSSDELRARARVASHVWVTLLLANGWAGGCGSVERVAADGGPPPKTTFCAAAPRVLNERVSPPGSPVVDVIVKDTLWVPASSLIVWAAEPAP